MAPPGRDVEQVEDGDVADDRRDDYRHPDSVMDVAGDRRR